MGVQRLTASTKGLISFAPKAQFNPMLCRKDSEYYQIIYALIKIMMTMTIIIIIINYYIDASGTVTRSIEGSLEKIGIKEDFTMLKKATENYRKLQFSGDCENL